MTSWLSFNGHNDIQLMVECLEGESIHPWQSVMREESSLTAADPSELNADQVSTQ
jgi:hypothetical protein